MEIKIKTDDYEFNLTSTTPRGSVSDISDTFRSVADIVTKLQTAAEEIEPVVVED